MEIFLVLAALAVAYYFVKHKSRPTVPSGDQPATTVDTPVAESASAAASAMNHSKLDTRDESEPTRQVGKLVPEESTLRRHYLQQQLVERQSITHPYPTDSVLRRHHESSVMASIVSGSQSVSVEQQQDNVTPFSFVTPSQIPEDSVLQRHFVTQLRATIEADLHPKPTESTLKRHYQQIIQAELADRLVQMAG